MRTPLATVKVLSRGTALFRRELLATATRTFLRPWSRDQTRCTASKSLISSFAEFRAEAPPAWRRYGEPPLVWYISGLQQTPSRSKTTSFGSLSGSSKSSSRASHFAAPTGLDDAEAPSAGRAAALHLSWSSAGRTSRSTFICQTPGLPRCLMGAGSHQAPSTSVAKRPMTSEHTFRCTSAVLLSASLSCLVLPSSTTPSTWPLWKSPGGLIRSSISSCP
mmetsp:Transcript_117727/g.344859  ORF Transcript_117727/g.344859 Transcript_117727/m.344859 type:complete len:220 (-) Transcript_117727:182-841(-)